MRLDTKHFLQIIDVPVFSCEVKIKKPDPRIYRLACKRLRLAPEACLYVGDGIDRELTGAKQVGLSPVLVLTSLVDAYDAQRLDVDVWQGRIVQSLDAIPTLL
jgi:putative hydrolase of the HAD superfamily